MQEKNQKIQIDKTDQQGAVTWVNGTFEDHQNWESNYNFANAINSLITENYSGLSRGIIKKTGMNVNGIYNQDLSPNTLLIEVGGVDNTIEEVYNTIEALANVLNKYIKGA